MSEEAVWQRLRQVDQLHELCLSLSKTKPLSQDEAIELRRGHAPLAGRDKVNRTLKKNT